MSVRIGHASINERGTVSGGRAGDQTGKEVCVRNWYNKPWNVMLICKDKALAKRAAEYMKAICDDDDFGYCQTHRGSGYLAIVNAGGNVSKAAPSEFDCSSLVASCYKLAGLNVSTGLTTRSIRKAFLDTGKFEVYTDAAHIGTDNYAEPGAVYLREGHHVVMALDYGAKSSTSSASAAKPSHSGSSAPTYTVGKDYTLQVELKVRTGAGTGNAAKSHSQLSSGGQRHDRDRDGALDAGTVITCQQVKNVGRDIWIKCPSGWLAAYYQGKRYVK